MIGDTLDKTEQRQMIEAFMKEFPAAALKERVGAGGKKFTYIEGHAAIHRVLANAPDFSMKYYDHWIHEDIDSKGKQRFTLNIVIGVSIPGLGEKIGLGVAVLGGGEDLAKGALTDAFKNALKYFGQGLSLYGEDYEAPPPPPSIKKQLNDALKAKGMTPAEIKAAVKEKFNRDTLSEEDAETWLGELNKSTPF